MARSAEHERPAADFTLSPFLKKVEKSMPKGRLKVIVNAERHRRTPRLLAISGGAICRGLWAWAVADSMRDAGRNWRRCHYSTIKNRNRKSKATLLQNGWQTQTNIMPKPSKYHQHGAWNPSKINEKSRLRRGYVFGAFLGRQMWQSGDLDWTRLATILH